jgi:hypothetical protein
MLKLEYYLTNREDLPITMKSAPCFLLSYMMSKQHEVNQVCSRAFNYNQFANTEFQCFNESDAVPHYGHALVFFSEVMYDPNQYKDQDLNDVNEFIKELISEG